LRSSEKTEAFLQVIVFDRDGTELHRSEKMDWADDLPHRVEAAQAFWVPGKDKLLLASDGKTGFYDLKTKSNTMLDVNLATYRNTPIRPDGKGFLACPGLGAAPVFVDWDGKKQDMQPMPRDAFEGPFDDKRAGMVQYPMMYSSHWDGDTAVVSWDDVRVTTDTDKLTVSLEQIKPAVSEDGKVIQDQVKLAGGAVVRAVELVGRYRQGKSAFNEERSRVEVVKPGVKEPKILMDAAGMFMIQPSPDGKKAVVRCSKSLEAIFTTANPNEDVLFVIDGAGDVADKIDLSNAP
jgi:hypothetical protein